jgi:hypothetical protein
VQKSTMTSRSSGKISNRSVIPTTGWCHKQGRQISSATPELETRSGSALLEQDEARFGQHPLLPSGQAAASLPSRQVADYLNDLDQIPRSQLL